jgi:hypothetical protein
MSGDTLCVRCKQQRSADIHGPVELCNAAGPGRLCEGPHAHHKFCEKVDVHEPVEALKAATRADRIEHAALKLKRASLEYFRLRGLLPVPDVVSAAVELDVAIGEKP